MPTNCWCPVTACALYALYAAIRCRGAAPVVFLLRLGDARDRPNARSARRVIAHEHRLQLVAVKPVCLGATRTAVHLDTGRIHHEIHDALFSQPAVQQETVAACFITLVDGCDGAEMATRLIYRAKLICYF